MKRFFRILPIIVFALLIIWIVVPIEVRLEKIADRPLNHSYFLTDCQKQDVCNYNSVFDKSIISTVDDYVKNKLEFGYRNDIQNGKANCVGYSQLWVNTYNYITRNLKNSPTARPVVGIGYLCIAGYKINLNVFLMSIVPSKHKNFIKNHDFVELEFQEQKYYFSPSIEDVFGNSITSYILKIKTCKLSTIMAK